jgi:inosine/xanthosine triphosphate pyrophosphatase family protein
VVTFDGETKGKIAPAPRGSRSFYWDTIFMPDVVGSAAGLTYAEIVEDPDLGLEYKMTISQSTKAMMQFLEHRLLHDPKLWS